MVHSGLGRVGRIALRVRALRCCWREVEVRLPIGRCCSILLVLLLIKLRSGWSCIFGREKIVVFGHSAMHGAVHTFVTNFCIG